MSNKEFKDGKSQIKLNKKMRMWHRYRNYCIGAAGIVVVLLICVAVISIVGKSSKKDDDVAVPPTTQQIAQSEPATIPPTAAPTEAVTQPVTEVDTQPVTQVVTQPATQAAASAALTVSRSAESEDFTSGDFFEDSLFLGDSIVSGLSFYNFLSSSQVVYSNGMTTDKALSEVSSIASENPSKVFIMVGLNDINYGTRSADVIAGNLITLANELHESLPSAKIYILSLLPVTSAFESNSSNKIRQSAIDDVNTQVSSLAVSAGYYYIDIAEAYKNSSGYLISDATNNGSNITHDYYPFMLNAIAEVAK
jgi:lysophospholipase L1-like esterase